MTKACAFFRNFIQLHWNSENTDLSDAQWGCQPLRERQKLFPIIGAVRSTLNCWFQERNQSQEIPGPSTGGTEGSISCYDMVTTTRCGWLKDLVPPFSPLPEVSWGVTATSHSYLFFVVRTSRLKLGKCQAYMLRCITECLNWLVLTDSLHSLMHTSFCPRSTHLILETTIPLSASKIFTLFRFHMEARSFCKKERPVVQCRTSQAQNKARETLRKKRWHIWEKNYSLYCMNEVLTSVRAVG